MACISRSKWGACGTVPRDSTKKDEIAIHHSVSPNRAWSPAQEREHLRAICQDHLARDFATIGYSWMIFPSGRCYVGRGLKGLPAATDGQNTGTWAICLIGNFVSVAPTVEARREARRLIVLLRDKHGANHLGGHQEFPNQATACPGSELLDYVEKWRDDFGLSAPEPS
jgi:hypothetical protein